MLDFFCEWTPEDCVITKLSSITLSKFLTTYLSNWNVKIIKYLNKRGDQINSTYDITIQQLASYYGHTGGKEIWARRKPKTIEPILVQDIVQEKRRGPKNIESGKK